MTDAAQGGGSLWFEDLTPGRVFDTASRLITHEAIVAFAQEWDPQPFHLSDEGGAATPFGRIIASGLHTLSVTARLMFDAGVLGGAIAGKGLDELRFHAPVHAGDVLSVRVTVADATASQRSPRGTVVFGIETRNQTGLLVYSARLTTLIRCRPV